MTEYNATLELVESESEKHYLKDNKLMNITFSEFPEEGQQFYFQREGADKVTVTSFIQNVEDEGDGYYTLTTLNSTYELILEEGESEYEIEFEYLPDTDDE